MADFEPQEWSTGQEYPAARMTELEATLGDAAEDASTARNTAAAANRAAGEAKDAVDAIPAPPDAPTADTLSGATATGRQVMKAADAAAARAAIGAGTGSSNLALGTTATTAKAGNYVPAWSEVTGKPNIPSVSGLATQASVDALEARIAALESDGGDEGA